MRGGSILEKIGSAFADAVARGHHEAAEGWLRLFLRAADQRTTGKRAEEANSRRRRRLSRNHG
jgi:hypothetical protein